MNDQHENAPSGSDAQTGAAASVQQADASAHEAPEIRGWALQWDTTELRKANLARRMRQLRQSSLDQ